ncbi:MAG UNVERIFIED_CONTAM: hypothetical protein LVT10_08015 [Anaerolineae bacterium]
MTVGASVQPNTSLPLGEGDQIAIGMYDLASGERVPIHVSMGLQLGTRSLWKIASTFCHRQQSNATVTPANPLGTKAILERVDGKLTACHA